MKTVLIQEEQQNPTQEIWISDVNLVIVTATKLQPTQYECCLLLAIRLVERESDML